MLFLRLRCLLLYPACVDLDTPFKSFDSISLCHCYAELYEIYTKRYSSPSDRLAYPLLLFWEFKNKLTV